jgi:hypothetical protein
MAQEGSRNLLTRSAVPPRTLRILLVFVRSIETVPMPPTSLLSGVVKKKPAPFLIHMSEENSGSEMGTSR